MQQLPLAALTEGTTINVGTVLTIVASLIAVFAVLASIFFGFLSWRNRDKADTKSSGQQEGIVLTTLGGISQSIKDIKEDMRESEKCREEQRVVVSERLAAVEASASSAHKRIDTILHIRTRGQYDPEGLPSVKNDGDTI